MSHKACHWLEEVDPGVVKAGAFRVLFHLCCAHNSKASADKACFPSQATLMKCTNLSNSGLNKCLNELETAGLIQRIRTRKPDGTKGPTYYILGFDIAQTQEPTPLSGVPANSTFGAEPTPLFARNQLHSRGVEPVRVTSKEPLEPYGSLSSGDDEAQNSQQDEIGKAVEAYNAAAGESGWPNVRLLSKARRSALSQRLRECGGLEGWIEALRKAQASPMCCGHNDRGWVANFDFLTRQSSFAKLMEGNYDNRSRNSRTPHQPRNGSDPALERIAQLAVTSAPSRRSGG